MKAAADFAKAHLPDALRQQLLTYEREKERDREKDKEKDEKEGGLSLSFHPGQQITGVWTRHAGRPVSFKKMGRRGHP
ncbi:protein phosphatase 1L [Lates japonicus]|uniref:Protein phosphatase 1L n=1 Tax=Lates japonicus TaxID=270547 RepID=A0AAD3RN89_LATJO|nr:protein phosphatase 1L [Lates japonicus]